MAIRAKVQCMSKMEYGENRVHLVRGKDVKICDREFVFKAWVGEDNEDFTFYDDPAKESAMAITMHVTNPACDFEPGREYYVDFVKAYSDREKGG